LVNYNWFVMVCCRFVTLFFLPKVNYNWSVMVWCRFVQFILPKVNYNLSVSYGVVQIF